MDVFLEQLSVVPDLAIAFFPKILLALAIVIVGRFVISKFMIAVTAATSKIPNIDATLAGFFTSAIYFACMALLVVAALSALSISMGFLGTVVGALVLALGFALQGALGDLASGILLIIFRPFKVGDDVELNGTRGFVTQLGLFSTRMRTRKNVEVIIANGDAFGNTIKNYFAFEKRRLDMDFGVSYDADLNVAISAIISCAGGDKRIYVDPVPWAKVVSLGDSSVNIQLRVWCDANQHRHIRLDLPYRVKKALDEAMVEIPYPHSTIIKKEA